MYWKNLRDATAECSSRIELPDQDLLTISNEKKVADQKSPTPGFPVIVESCRCHFKELTAGIRQSLPASDCVVLPNGDFQCHFPELEL